MRGSRACHQIDLKEPESRQKLKWTTGSNALFYGLIFLYFLTVSAELLFVEVYLFKPKLNHILALLLLPLTFFSGQRCFFPKRVIYPLFFLFFSQLISSFFSPCFSRSLGYVVANGVTVLLFFLLPIQWMFFFDRQKILKLYFGSFLCIGSYAAVQFIFSFFGFEDPLVRQRVLGFIARGQGLSYEPSYYALYAIAPVMYYNTKKVLQEGSFFRLKTLVPLLLVNFLLIASTSTGALFGYVFFLIAFPFLARGAWMRPFIAGLVQKTVRMGWIFFGLFAGFALCFYQLFLTTFYKFFAIGLAQGSFLERWEAIENAWHIFWAHPFFGVGLGGVGPLVYLQNQYLFEKVVLDNPAIEQFTLLDPKNVLFELLGSLGLLGLCAWGAFLYAIYSLFCKALTREIPLEQRIEIFALFLSLLVMLFCLQFNQGLFRNYVWLHMALGVGYVLALSQNFAKKKTVVITAV